MSRDSLNKVRNLLLTRCKVVKLPTGNGDSNEQIVRAVELELSAVGFVVSSHLRRELFQRAPQQLKELLDWIIPALRSHLGADQKHEPLFRNFPQEIPRDTNKLWWQKFLVHYLQADDQTCLFCDSIGTTHVLDPCQHVVCSSCFDGKNYSACPVCEHHVDRNSPFFLPSIDRLPPNETIKFKKIDLIESQEQAAQDLFVSLCQRTQALSPTDREALLTIVRGYESSVVQWLPETIPVRENIAIVFGTLFIVSPVASIFAIASRYLKTATDILRFIAVASGTDGSLQTETITKTIKQAQGNRGLWQQLLQRLDISTIRKLPSEVQVQFTIKRFKMVKLTREVRRAILELLNGFSRSSLLDDMFRHRSYWVWVGEFLHPHEYAKRFPLVAEAFEILRKQSPDGTQAQKHRTWNGELEEAFFARRTATALRLLCDRPGMFARQLDHLLRICQESQQMEFTINAFLQHIASFATPVLLTLASHLPQRLQPSADRVYWPKSKVGLGVFDIDRRSVLPRDAVATLVAAIELELLRRFEQLPHFDSAIIDEHLKSIIVPFNERTASVSAVNLPRGSNVHVPVEKTLRMFLHWCQPRNGGKHTDLDLSVAFYDRDWAYLGVCSYYQLKFESTSLGTIAVSSGDLRDAPWPDGASEFVDLNCNEARKAGIKYAVMVVNNYWGLPFEQLERGFAGLMIRDDTAGYPFDPRTVKLKFALAGENGVFIPLVVDLEEECMHWLDVQSKGQLSMNNVASSNKAITKICPTLINYFESGTRPSMYDLAILHASARSNTVTVRGAVTRTFQRRQNETAASFLERIRSNQMNQELGFNIDENAIFAALLQGDLPLPAGSSVYSLFPEVSPTTLSASDLLSG